MNAPTMPVSTRDKAAILAVTRSYARLLAPEGILVVELGRGQSGPVASIFAPTGLAPVAWRHDLLGVVRAVAMQALP